MATRSRIGVMLDDGTIKNSYCHWDGYVRGVGLKLVENYDSFNKAKDLINLGDLSYVERMLSTDEPHTFDNPAKGVTVAYMRDRGEKNVESKVLSMDEWMSVSYSSGIDFYYLYSGGQWWVYDLYAKDGWQNVKSFFPQYSLTAEELACNI